MQVSILQRKKERGFVMAGIVENYIDKECIIYTMNSQVSGFIKEVKDGWIVVDTGNDKDIINLQYVIRIREYPKNKKGKKKTVFD